MPSNNQFKSLRHGGIRTPQSRGMSRSARHVESNEVPTPNIDAHGHQPFTRQQLLALAQWLQHREWPRGALNIYALEGLLTALLVLPLGIQPGAWLPLIWNESGWKIPSTLQDTDRYQEFVELIVSFMRAIDAGLIDVTPKFVSVINTLIESRPNNTNPYHDWVHGFGLAIQKSNYLNSTPDSIIRQALHAIGAHASAPAGKNVTSTLRQAVLVLSQNRYSRGPLGPLCSARDSLDNSGALRGSETTES